MTYRAIPLAVALGALLATTGGAQEPTATEQPFVTVDPTGLEWNPIQPPGWAVGMEMAVVRGNPPAADQPYVVRLRFRDGYRFPPHYHPVAENVTVLSGSLVFAMGERTDESQLKTYGPGDYLFIDARHPHFGGARGQTVIQLHGVGPFEIITVGSPQDRR